MCYKSYTMSVTLRIRENKKKGVGYYYLDYFYGYKTINGKKVANRKAEYIGIKTFLKPKGIERDFNKQNKKLAEQYFLKKSQEYLTSSLQLPKSHKMQLDFFSYWDDFVSKKSISKRAIDSYSATKDKLIEYRGDKLMIGDVDYAYCRDFSNFLQNYTKSNGEHLSSSTINAYFKKLRLVLSELKKEGIITENPSNNIKLPKIIHKPKEWLTIEEIQMLINTPCRVEVLKKFYLLSCFCGLRHSDCMRLKWKDLIKEGDYSFFKIQIQKTSEYIKIPLSNDALKIIGERKGNDDKILIGLKYGAHSNMILQKWAFEAGIKKNITPHTARHTFATNFAMQTNDPITLQHLLGHSDSKSSKVYMHMAEQKPFEQINKLKQLIK